MLGVEAEVGADEVENAANHQAAASQEDESAGDFERDETGAEPAHGGTVGGPKSAATQSIGESAIGQERNERE
jgi:hypothetical protein